jgi:predicted permease
VFGGAEQAVGRSITVNARRLSVVGVLPPGFAGATPSSDVDVWIPSSTYYYVRHFGEALVRARGGRGDGSFYTFIIRLAHGATVEGLRAELDVLVPSLAEQYPDENEAFRTARARVFPGLGPHELMRNRLRRLMANLLLVGVVLIVLGCANVANLLISRGVQRQRERAVRVALGASRTRLLQLLMTESCVLAVAGAALGVVAAVWLKELIQTLLLPEVAGPGADVVVPMDLHVLATTLVIAVGCGLVAGLAPAWIGSASRPGADLGRGDLRTSSARSRLRTGFAVTQLALSLALVTNAVLLVATLRNLGAVELGFDPHGVTVHHLDLGGHGYRADRAMVYNRDLLDRLSSERALSAVSLSSNYPFGSGHGMDLQDPDAGEEARLEVRANFVTEGYFSVLGIRILSGRAFERSETMGAGVLDGSPAIVDEHLARRLFHDAEPLGRRIRVARTMANDAHDLVVVGVAGNARWNSLTDESEPMLYLPFAYGGEYASTDPVVLVRSDVPVRDAGQLVQAKASAIDPSLPVFAAQPLAASIARELAGRRVFAWVLNLLGGLGFALAAVGLYGLLAQMVGERTREFGIRMAIGGARAHVFGLVLRQAAWIAILGGAAGLGLGALGSRFVEAQLFGVRPLEPWVYAGSAAGLAAVVFLASVWPARQATRIQPVEALRAE